MLCEKKIADDSRLLLLEIRLLRVIMKGPKGFLKVGVWLIL